jgi:hypothetical protein
MKVQASKMKGGVPVDLIKLISNMKLEEKLAQMTQLRGDYYVSEGATELMGLSYGGFSSGSKMGESY